MLIIISAQHLNIFVNLGEYIPMLVVSSNLREKIEMAEETNIEDLEDGEIESDGEEIPEKPEKIEMEDIKLNDAEPIHNNKQDNQDYFYNKPGKKKKNKSKKGEQGKNKNKNKKNRNYSSSTAEDDFAGSIEKAIRTAMKRNDNGENQFGVDVDERRKYKKRKKYDGNKDGPGKKRKKQDYSDEMDESEMMCVRGASPVKKNTSDDIYHEDDRDSYASDSSDDRGHHQQRNQRQRPPQRDRNNKNNKNDRRRGGAHPMQDPDGVCLYFMQGKCHKGDDCIYSHDANPPRKMELCKFYLMECCAKRDKCLYMHADFPCKYYHTGLPCIYKDECKFAHGKPLTDNLKNILLKHIESAPKEILGDFPRLNREGALKMIHTTQAKLLQQYPECLENQDINIPSLFELNLANHPQGEGNQFNSLNNQQNKISPKIRHSRWQNENSDQNYTMNMSPNSDPSNVLSIRNLTGVLTPRQILDLSKMGIENLDQLGQLTVLQLNGIGLSLKQITEIQLNTMSIQKLGLINSNNEPPSPHFTDSTGSKDLDLRVPPSIADSLPVSSNLPGKDIDMRFQPVVSRINLDNAQSKLKQNVNKNNKDMIDIDQYTKDALKYASKENENIEPSHDSYEHQQPTTSTEIKDIDHRVLPFPEESLNEAKPAKIVQKIKESDTDIRFRQPEPYFKSPEKQRHRRSTTDDEDNNLLIDEKWYSSDEEKGNKNKKSPASSPLQTSLSPQTPVPHVFEPSSVISKLGDLSKIDISEEVTKLLNTMKNNLNESKNENSSEPNEPQKSRDPRSRRLSSGDKVSDPPKATSHRKYSRVSIYECVDGEPTDGRRRSDVDLRKADFNLPSFGDTDLRQSTSGDIDLRLGLPFKAIPNYTPASEIDGSINSHPPIPFKVVLIDIPRPDYTDIRNSTAKSQALVDPRLRKVFRLSVDESSSDNEKEKPTKAAPTGPRVDPRRKPQSENISNENKNVLELQTICQNSDWFKELSSTQKIFVNQHLAPVTQAIKLYQQEKIPGKVFDVSLVQSNALLCSIFTNLGISLGENGELSYLPKPKEGLLKTPANYNQNNSLAYGMNSSNMIPPGVEGSNMHMMNNMNNMNMPPMGMGGMNNMNMGGMHGYNPSMQDPRGGPTPGLLGIAPNIPHSYNNNYGAPNNFGNMPYNGPIGPGNNDFNFMDNEQNFPRFPNRGGHRGRGNEQRWNRGGPGRGNRKGFNDRGSWKK